MLKPNNKKGAERLLDCVTYVSQGFQMRLSHSTPSEKDAMFDWQDTAFTTVKQVVTTVPILYQ